MANTLVEIYQSMIGSWERRWELIYKAQSGYVRQQGSSIDSFLENGIWIPIIFIFVPIFTTIFVVVIESRKDSQQ